MEILNTIQGTEITTVGVLFPISFIALLIGIGFFFAGLAATRNRGVPEIIFGILIGALGLIGMLNSDEKPTGEYKPTQYEVRITDENYIIDASKYRIVEKRGEIILLEEIKEE